MASGEYGSDRGGYDHGYGPGGEGGVGGRVSPRGPQLTIDVTNANRGRGGQMQHQQLDTRADPVQLARNYQAASVEAHSIMEDDESPQNSSGEDEEGTHRRHHEAHGDDEEHEGDDLDDSGSFSDSLSSSPSIPDEDIDFALVYALHTFLATVDGQASVVKGDKLLLLDDSNSYWWLVRVLKTQAVGYIPAENIETPYERLARLNKHRNVDLTSVTQEDVITGPSSTAAQHRFHGRIPPSQQPHPHESQHPSAKGILASPSHKDHPRNISPTNDRPERADSRGKTVLFTAPTYYEHSANGLSDEDDEYDEEMEGEEGQLRGDQVFDDDDGEESEFSDDGLTEDPEDHDEAGGGEPVVRNQQGVGAARQATMVHQDEIMNDGEGEDITQEEWEERQRWYQHQQRQQQVLQQQQQQQAQQEAQQQRSMSPQQQAHLQQQQRQDDLLRRQVQQPVQYQQQQPQPPQASDRDQQIVQQRSQSAGGQYSQPPEQQQDLRRRGSDPSLGAGRRPSDPLPRRPSDASSSSRRPSDDRSPQELNHRLSEEPTTLRRPSETSIRSLANDAFDPEAPTKKLTATPPIVRDPTFDMNNPLGDIAPRASSPVRVRGVEVVDIHDPRYTKLISDRRAGENFEQRRPSGDLTSAPPVDNETSLQSIDTTSSFASGQFGSEDGQRSALSPVNVGGVQQPATKKLKKGPRESMDVESEKKKKGGGILSGLFRKKDKKKKDSIDEDARISEESMRASPTLSGRKTMASPSMGSVNMSPRSEQEDEPREAQTAQSMFSTDATLRQQEVEAKQAMYHQYGVQRSPGDLSNTMTPRSNVALQQTLSPPMGFISTPSHSSQRMRPGSLVGSPSIPGLEVPLLSVMRVFAGDHIESDATFKTVLLNHSTNTSDLVKQSMQRFRLSGSADRDEYYLTVKELGGDERPLYDDQKPLVIFEALSDTPDGSGFIAPSVKRSSVGSINSIASNLSLNPAITRLGMNDFSDDSAVKFYLHRRTRDDHPPSTAASETDSILTATGLTPDHSISAASPSYRFAVRIVIHPEDLPENVAFDPQSLAIIPKSILQERQQRNGAIPESQVVSPHNRDKIIFFPRNTTVSEVIEAGLDRFGIVDAVVDGGDEVEDRISRRRSVSRVKYNLAVFKEERETLLPASGKILDAYTTPPIFKPYDRSSKEFRRRSVDATLILGIPQDVQESDPVFIIRRAPIRSSGSARNSLLLGLSPTILSPANSDRSMSSQQQQYRRSFDRQNIDPPIRAPPLRSMTESSQESVYETPAATPAATEDEAEIFARAASPQATRQEIIAAQRAASRANQRAVLSAQKNAEQGVDILVPEKGTIRSTRADDRVRYSYIDEDGTETDISEIVESEWSQPAGSSAVAGSDKRSASRQTATSTDADSFKSAHSSSPTSTIGPGTASHDDASPDDEDEEDRQAISALRQAPVTIDDRPLNHQSSSSSLRKPLGADVLEDALGTRPTTSPMFNESLQDRLDRVLAKVKDDKAKGRAASPRVAGSGRNSPGLLGRAASPLQLPVRSRSPLGNATGRDSPSITQVITPDTARPSPLSEEHGKKPSIGSLSSVQSSAVTNENPSTPITPGSNANFTPISSVNSNHRPPVVYRDDFGLDTLMTLVDSSSSQRSIRPKRQVGVDSLFGHSLRDATIHPEVRSWYDPHQRQLDDLDSRLDALLLQAQSIRV